jgi:hypothetical protein
VKKVQIALAAEENPHRVHSKLCIQDTRKVRGERDECANSLDFHAHAHGQPSSNTHRKQSSKNSQPFMSCSRHTAPRSAGSAKTSKHSTAHGEHEKINFCNSANGTSRLGTQQTQAIAMQVSLSAQCNCEKRGRETQFTAESTKIAVLSEFARRL